MSFELLKFLLYFLILLVTIIQETTAIMIMTLTTFATVPRHAIFVVIRQTSLRSITNLNNKKELVLYVACSSYFVQVRPHGHVTLGFS